MTDTGGDAERGGARPLRVALPNKGRLSEESLELFEQAGLKAQFRADRALLASLGNRFQAIFVRAQDVAEFVADGAAELGITGRDLVAESGREIPEILDLGFGACRLVLAVPDDSPVQRPEELPPNTRIATSFPHVTSRYFDELGIPVRIAPVSGAAEIAPHLGVAEAIVDLVSTGSTLRVHRLRPVGTILTSSARLLANPERYGEPDTRREMDGLVAALESVLRAERKRYLMANVPRDRLEKVREILPGISGPTIVDVLDRGSWVAVHAVVDDERVYETIGRLKELGAEGLLVTRIERLMP